MGYAEVINSCSEKAVRVGFDRLTDVERIVVLVSWFDFEVVCGGFSQFYYNSAGDRAAETVSALEAVGALKAAAALRTANARFPGGRPSQDREERYVGWKMFIESDSLDPIDDSLYPEGEP